MKRESNSICLKLLIDNKLGVKCDANLLTKQNMYYKGYNISLSTTVMYEQALLFANTTIFLHYNIRV